MVTSDAATVGRRYQSQQNLKIVLRAEFWRLLRPGGMRKGAVAAAAFGVAVGLLTTSIMAYVGRREPGTRSVVEVTLPVEATTSIMAVVLSGVVAVHYARNAQTGGILASLTLVPDRARLLLAQGLAVAGIALSLALAGSTLVALAAVSLSDSGVKVVPAVVGVLSGSVAAATAGVLAFLVATLAFSVVVAVLVFVGWWIVFPLAMALVSATLPAWIAPIASWAVASTPTALLAKATTVSTLPRRGPSNLLEGHLGLIVWVAVLGVIVHVSFERRSL